MFRNTGKSLQQVASILFWLSMIVGSLLLLTRVIIGFVSGDWSSDGFTIYELNPFGIIGIMLGTTVISLCINGFGKIVEWYELHSAQENSEKDDNNSTMESKRKLSFLESVGLVQEVEKKTINQEHIDEPSGREGANCNQCGEVIPENVHYCPKCGAKQE